MFDGGTGNFAVTLHRVGITDREQGAFDKHRKVDGRAGNQIWVVEIAAIGARRNRVQHLVRIRRHAHDTGERFQRDANAVRELDLVLLGVERERLQHVLVEFTGQKSEFRMDLHPSPVRGLELEQANGEHIARFGAFDIDRPGQRMNSVPVDLGRVLDGRIQIQLSAGALVRERLDNAAGRHADDGLDQAAELGVRLLFRQYEIGREGRRVDDLLRSLGAAAGRKDDRCRPKARRFCVKRLYMPGVFASRPLHGTTHGE